MLKQSRNFSCCHQTSTEQKRQQLSGLLAQRTLNLCGKQAKYKVKLVADPDPLSCVLHNSSQFVIPVYKRGNPSNTEQMAMARWAVARLDLTTGYDDEGDDDGGG